MKRAVCPEGQIDIFPPDTMAELFRHPAPAAPLPPLPFERNKEIDVPRAARILDTSPMTVRRMCEQRLLRNYRLYNDRGKPFFRIEHASLVEYCDQLRLTYHLPLRKPSREGSRPADNTILPFPAGDNMTVPEVANHLGVSENTVRKLFDSGDLLAYMLCAPSAWRVSRSSFAEYLRRKHREAGRPQTSPAAHR